MSSRIRIIALLAATLLHGCALFKKDKPAPRTEFKPTLPIRSIEPEITEDATPPPGYNPIWFKGVKPLDSLSKNKKPFLTISRAEAKPDSIRLYLHLMDTAGYYYAGGSHSRQKWCIVADTTQKDTHIVQAFNLEELTEQKANPMSFYLIMDYSGSMGSVRTRFVEDCVRRLIKDKRDQDAFGIIKFDEDVGVESFPSRDVNTIEEAIKAHGIEHYGGLTAIGDAVFKGLRLFGEPIYNKKRAIIVFSDGYDNYSSITRDSIINLARNYRIPICAIDFGDSIETKYLSEMAEKTGGVYHHIYKTHEFDHVFKDIYYRLMYTYSLAFDAKTVGKHKLYLKLCLKDTALEARSVLNNYPLTEEDWLLHEAIIRKNMPASTPPPVRPKTLPDQLPGPLVVHFDFNKYDPKARSYKQIQTAIETLKKFPDLLVTIHGHTDYKGSDSTNAELSHARSRAIRRELLDAGIEPHRVRIDGFGEEKPVADNETGHGRARNRRAEIIFHFPEHAITKKP